MTEFFKRQLDNRETVFYSLVQKESENGFFLNKRIFLMLENRFICYLSSPNLNFPLSIDYINKNAKAIIPLSQIHRLLYQENNKLQIDFWVNLNGRRTKKYWTLKMETPSLLAIWQEVFDEYSNRSRKGTLETKNSKQFNNNFEGNVYDSISKLTGRTPISAPNNFEAKLSEQIAHSNQLLLGDSSESYFANLHLITPSKAQSNNFSATAGPYLSHKHKDHGSYFSLLNQHECVGCKFKNYFVPNLQDIFQFQSRAAKFVTLEETDKEIQEFIEYAKQMVIKFIEGELPQLIRNRSLRSSRLRNSLPQGIVYDKLEDIVIQMGLIELKNAGGNTCICDQSQTKIIANNFKNMNYLQEIICKDAILRTHFFMPMCCLISYKGCTCLVTSKIQPTSLPDYHLTSVQPFSSLELFQRLSAASKMDFAIFQDIKRLQFLPLNERKDKFAIVQARSFLPELQPDLPIREEAFSRIFEIQKRAVLTNKRQMEDQNLKIAEHLLAKINELSDLMNKLQVYPLAPCQMAPLFHSYGINIKYISKIYANIAQPFVQNLLKTEATIRAFKTVFNKKLQETLSSQRGPQATETAAHQLLNAFLGRGEDSVQIWKVISLHCQKQFGLSVAPEEISKGYLLLGLCYHLNADIYPSTSNIEKMFSLRSFVEGIKLYPKIKCLNILPSFLRDLQRQYTIDLKPVVFSKIMAMLQLEDRPFPSFVKVHSHLHNQLLNLLSFYSNPKETRLAHLNIFGPQSSPLPLKSVDGSYLHRKLTEIRWQIKNKSPKEHILLLMGKLKQTVQDYYGSWHPFISDIFELKGLYHLKLGEQSQAIEANKQALGNMIQCCGNNQRHLKLSNSHYHIAECLEQCHRFNQALSHHLKAKQILQFNGYQLRSEYAHILVKIGKILLLNNKDSQSYENFYRALTIYENTDLFLHWDLLVDLYELISRCTLKPKTNALQGIKLAEHCAVCLQKILSIESKVKLCSDTQLIRILKIVVESFIDKLKKEDRILLRDYLIEVAEFLALTPQPNDLNFKQSFIYFKELIIGGSFLLNLQNYISIAGESISRRKMGGRMLPVLGQPSDGFDEFMRQMLKLTGESFLLNIIK